jgi:hypothetical protein
MSFRHHDILLLQKNIKMAVSDSNVNIKIQNYIFCKGVKLGLSHKAKNID